MTSDIHWYDGADTSTITHVSGEISQWDDKTGTKDLTQGTAASNPNNTTMNGRNAIYFDGGDNLRNADLGLTLLDTDVFFTVAFKPDAQATERLLGFPGWHHYMDTNGYGNFFGDAWVMDSGSAATAAAHVHTAKISDTASQFWRDGSSLVSNSYGSQADQSPTTFDIGQAGGGAYSGVIAEIVIYTDGSERVALEAYLTEKWGTP